MKAEILECRSRAGHAQVKRFPGQRVDRMHGWGDDRGYESIRMGMRQQFALVLQSFAYGFCVQAKPI